MLSLQKRTRNIDAPPPATSDEQLRRRLSALGMQIDAPGGLAAQRMSRPADLAELDLRLTAGTRTFAAVPRSQSVVDAVLGVDFGSSSTKIVARLPFEAGSPAVAIPVPGSFQSDDHPHLWNSWIWIGNGGSLSLAPTPGGMPHIGLKIGILALAGNPAATDARRGGDDLACGFLALQIRQARGWLLTRYSGVFGRGVLRWWVNVGFPAASLDEPLLKARYDAIVAAALELSLQSGPLTLPIVQAALASVADLPADQLDLRNGALFPEIAAAVAGYAWSSRRRDGLFAMVDVGAGTLDVCTFNLFPDREGALRCPIFKADVSLLGVEVWRRCVADPELEQFFPLEVRLRQRTVIWKTKTSRYRSSDRWTEGLPVFLIGGGAASKVHRDVTARLSPWLKENRCAGAIIETMPPPTELTFQCQAGDVQRLAVAVGLSLFKTDIPQPVRPSDIEDDAPPRVRDNSGLYVSKDMT